MVSDATNNLNNSVAFLANAGIILGTAALTRDIIRDTTRVAKRQPRQVPRKRKSILDDPFGDF